LDKQNPVSHPDGLYNVISQGVLFIASRRRVLNKQRPILVKAILFLFLFLILVSGCRSPGPTNTSTLRYPADISGSVIIASYIIVMREIYVPAVDVLWVANIKFTNRSYELPDISSYDHWNVVAGNTYYGIPEILKIDKLPLLTVAADQTEEKLVCFQVPANLNIGSARLAYQAQKLVSLGQLTGGRVVNGYNWDFKNAISQ
jgi:hypothetical protein